ncbi:Hypothetical protein CINCED_3A011020 [Cinara cedri]|uniref:Uncharacterized protein n=1 Tax=Cinara cedri TaxID=506608 RepID=A0A5E4N934_9HEMI|nr:Hypothetical protein CINCED_3A011020 [Cinara cedri]
MNSRNIQVFTVILLVVIAVPCMQAKPCSFESFKVIKELFNKLLDVIQTVQTEHQQFLTTTKPIPSTPLEEPEEHMLQGPFSSSPSTSEIDEMYEIDRSQDPRI